MGKKTLNPKQELFCKLYATDREFFGNGVESYLEAYGLDKQKDYNTAKSNAYKLLTNTDICDRINELLEEGGLNDGFVDKRLLYWIKQGASPQTSIAAIKEYNILQKRISKTPLVDTEGLNAITEMLREMGKK